MLTLVIYIIFFAMRLKKEHKCHFFVIFCDFLCKKTPSPLRRGGFIQRYDYFKLLKFGVNEEHKGETVAVTAAPISTVAVH